MKPPLVITGSGMCCPLGFDAPSTRAAIRAGLCHFEESDFLDARGQRVLVARVPLGDIWGPRRLATMFELALTECTASASDFDPALTALLLTVADRGRAGYSDSWAHACFNACSSVVGKPFHPESRVLPLGRAGIGPALTGAHTLLVKGYVKRVVVAGVDSYLNAHSINHFLRKVRILSVGASDGFVPGEGAGALLVELASAARPASIRVLGVGVADEPATLDNDEPQLARGLAAAARQALSTSGYHANDMGFRLADLSGESFFFREAAIVSTRLLDHPTGRMPLLHLGDCVGETGAAVGPLSLAYLAGAMPRGHTPGALGLAHFASDGGARAALVVAA
jgi:3-oxoacyl-[acyl-carrier-protein] synthase-1